MPTLSFDVAEIEDTGSSTVNKSGYAYVGRKHFGRSVSWITTKNQNKTE